MPTRRTRPPRPLEREIQRNGIRLLESLGWRCFRRNTGAMRGQHKGKAWFVRFSEPGASDVWAITPDGYHAEWEAKRPGERPTPDQVKWLLKTNGIGGSVSFWADNLMTLERVARHAMAGGRIVYLGTHGDYDLA